MKRGEIWIADLGWGVGSEQAGVRPVLIVQNDIGNKHSPTTIICPITTSNSQYTATHVFLKSSIGIPYNSRVMCEQVRVIDKERLHKFTGVVLGELTMECVDEMLRRALSLPNTF